MKKYNIAVIGATGIVGETVLSLLHERNFPVGTIQAIASERSLGETVMFGHRTLIVDTIEGCDFSTIDIAFFAAGTEISLQYAPIAAKAGCTVIDKSTAFRYEKDIPLVVPEVNADALRNYSERNIIANPNCSTIPLVAAIKPIYDLVGIQRINIATYQSVSGAGKEAIGALAKETVELLSGEPIDEPVLSKQIAFNVLPKIDAYHENGYTLEEMKLLWETQKILNDDTILVNATAVRVPVFFGHSAAIHLETEKYISAADVRALLQKAPGIIVVDGDDYPTPITHAANQDGVFVGRIRNDISHQNGIDLWVVSDNVRKGAALNAIQIAELLVQNAFYKH